VDARDKRGHDGWGWFAYVPAIYVFEIAARKAWMPAPSAGMTECRRDSCNNYSTARDPQQAAGRPSGPSESQRQPSAPNRIPSGVARLLQHFGEGWDNELSTAVQGAARGKRGVTDMTIKALLLATASTVALTGAALAADIPMRKAPPPPLAYPAAVWTGGYIGGHVGVARLNASCTQPSESYNYYGSCMSDQGGASQVNSDTGFTAGVQIGYDIQSGSFVYGVAADWTFTDLDRSQVTYGSYPNTLRTAVDWLASFRGRMGLAVDNTLVYITAGLAAGRVIGENWETISADESNQGSYGNLQKTKIGWVAGLGVEHKFGRNWSVKGEFLYYDLGRDTGKTRSGSYSYATEYHFEVLTARVGVNYRW
jgi:outer membrane immunogenic protein